MKKAPLYTQLRNHRLPAATPKSTRSLKRRLTGGQRWIQAEVNINNKKKRNKLPLFVAAMAMSMQPSVDLKVWHKDRYHALFAIDDKNRVCLIIWDNNGNIREHLTSVSSL
jgi:hypothetical protein